MRSLSVAAVLLFAMAGLSFAPQSNAVVVGISAPPTVAAGQPFTATVAFRNAGPDTWTTAASYYAGTVNDSVAFGNIAQRTGVTGAIPPGGTATIAVSCIAPATAGNYPLQLRMLQNGVNWFGGVAQVNINVTGGQPPQPPPAGKQFPACQPGDIVSATIFVLNDPPPTMDSQVRQAKWTNNGPPMRVFKAYHWMGVDMGARADIHSEITRDRDGLLVSVIQADHYAEPTGPGDNCKWNDFLFPFVVKTGESITLTHFGNNFNPARPAHYGIRVDLYATALAP